MAKAPKTVRRGSPVSREWSYRYRKVKGQRRLVRIARTGAAAPIAHRHLHTTPPSSASEIFASLGITEQDIEAAEKAL